MFLSQHNVRALTSSVLFFSAIQYTDHFFHLSFLFQFYAQGRAHHALHSWWHGPLQELLRFWSLLEAKTAVVVNTLQGAAESRFDHHQQQQQSGSSFDHQRQQQKQSSSSLVVVDVVEGRVDVGRVGARGAGLSYGVPGAGGRVKSRRRW